MDPSDFRDNARRTRAAASTASGSSFDENGLPTVIAAMEDTPAAKAGVLSGRPDLANQQHFHERMDLQDAINFLPWACGRESDLTLLRLQPMKSRNTRCNGRRSKSKCQRRKAARCRLTGPFKIGYIRLIQFTNLQPRNFRRRSTTCRSKAMHAHSRSSNNPGGLLNSAVGRVRSIFAAQHKSGLVRRGGSSPRSMNYSTSGAKKELPNFPMVC